jgi:hypothetical protein
MDLYMINMIYRHNIDHFNHGNKNRTSRFSQFNRELDQHPVYYALKTAWPANQKIN